MFLNTIICRVEASVGLRPQEDLFTGFQFLRLVDLESLLLVSSMTGAARCLDVLKDYSSSYFFAFRSVDGAARNNLDAETAK